MKKDVGIEARLTFDKQRVPMFWDAAAIGIESMDAKEAARHAEDNKRDWSQLLEDTQEGLASLLGVSAEEITLYHNTTAGAQRVFARLGHLLTGSEPTFMTTDFEYPGIMALADEAWTGRVVVAAVAEQLWRGDATRIPSILRDVFLVAKPGVIYISHVARTFGYILDLEFLRFVRTVAPQTIIIVDGAQAVGQLPVGPEILNLVDFYVFSGHKWLCGKQTIGVVVSDPSWQMSDPAQGYSLSLGSRGTGSAGALASLAKAVKDFNGSTTGETVTERMEKIARHLSQIAERIEDALGTFGERTVRALQKARTGGAWQGCGIVCVIGPSDRLLERFRALVNWECYPLAASELRGELWRNGSMGGAARGGRFRCSIEYRGKDDERPASVSLEKIDLPFTSVPMPHPRVLRFCSHYFHSRSDVDGLMELLLAEVLPQPKEES